MIVILFYAILVSNIILTQEYVLDSIKQSSDDNEQERLVVKELASIIRHREHSKLENGRGNLEAEQVLPEDAVDTDTAEGVESSFSYQAQGPMNPDNVPRLNDHPMAVPPSDYRFFRNDFSNDYSANMNEESNSVPVEPKDYEKIRILTPNRNEDLLAPVEKFEKKKTVETDDEKQDAIQRQKMYSHFMLNPSFIPYGGQAKSIYVPENYDYKNTTNLLAITYGTMCAIVAISVIVAFSIYRRLRKKVKDAEDVDYPAYGVTGPNKEIAPPTGDRHLAHSAQMYHYQHQKQQMKAMEKNSDSTPSRKETESGSEDDDFAVYECPGLAPVTGEMEVKNPMFQEENEVKSSPSTKESRQNKNHSDANEK